MYLVLAHFDSLRGPIVFTSVPSLLPPEIAQMTPKFLDMSLKYTVFEFLMSGPTLLQFINLPFEIPSLDARGHVESLMFSVIFDQISDIHLIAPTIQEIVKKFRSFSDIHKAFHRTTNSKEGSAQFRQIEQIMQESFNQLQHKLEQFQIAERVFTQKSLDADTPAVKVAQLFNEVFITTIDARMPQGAAILYEAGTIVGNNILPTFVGDNAEAILAEAAAFWKKYALGQIDEVRINPHQLFFNVYECFECSHYPNISKPVCKFDEGVLTSLLGKKLQQDVKVTETECYAMGKGRCCFTVDIKPLPPRKF